MKVHEAPEKIYMTPSFGEPDNVLLASFSKSHLDFHRDIEYTRTDAFIKKALKWMTMKECIDNVLSVEMIDEFKTYMEKE